MIRKIVSIIILLFIVRDLQADPKLPGVIAATEGDPCTLIAGCVNAITGDLVYSHKDIVIPGAIPLVLRCSYASGDGTGDHGGWEILPHFRMNIYNLYDRGLISILVAEPTGGMMGYYAPVRQGEWAELRPQVGKHGVGLTNNASGVISGRTNLKNHRVHFKTNYSLKHLQFDAYVKTGEGLHRHYSIGRWNSTKRIHEAVLRREELPNGAWILYDYDAQARPTGARTVSPDESTTYAWARFHYEGSEQDTRNCTIETSDGRKLRYRYHRGGEKKKRYFYLQDVTGDLPEPQEFIYAKPPKYHKPLVTDIVKAGELLARAAYYYAKDSTIDSSSDPRCQRVKELWSPTGPQGALEKTYHLAYMVFRWVDDQHGFNHPCWTSVEGPDKLTEHIFWTKEMRPSQFRFFKSPGELLFAHRLTWGPEKSDLVGNLMARELLNSDDSTSSLKLFTYDAQHNPTSETFHGNLSGKAAFAPRLDPGGYVVGGEPYAKRYTYSGDGRNLMLTEEHDNGLTIRYRYLPGTNLLSSKLTGTKSSILQREFYQYDQHHLLIRESLDDGSSHTETDLTGVQERKVTAYRRDARGLPIRIEQSYFDPRSQQEKLLSALELHYSAELLVIRKDLYDSNNTLYQTLHTEYDRFGRVIKESDPLGRYTSFTYDKRGHCTQIDDPSGLLTIYQQYDVLGRLLKIDKASIIGETRSESYQWSAGGHKIASTNTQGHETKFEVDPWGKVKKTIHPFVMAEGQKIQPIETKAYDPMGNVTTTTDIHGDMTRILYNAYGKEIHKTFPDGSYEETLYNWDGTIKEKTNVHGAKTVFTHDLFARPTHKQIYSPEGELLAEESFIYNTFHLIEQIDAEGHSVRYEYDGAGRTTAEHSPKGSRYFFYDERGRPQEIAYGLVREITHYNELDQVIEEQMIDDQGRLLSRKTYAYDPLGARSEESFETTAGMVTTHFQHDHFGRLIAEVDPAGKITRIAYDEEAINTHGQKILRKTTTDPLGVKTIEEYNPLGWLVFQEKISPFGETLTSHEWIFNGKGHPIQEIRTIFVPDGSSYQTTTKRSFGPQSTLISIEEASGTTTAKTTSMTYAPGGLLQRIDRSDQASIWHTYDSLGRLIAKSVQEKPYLPFKEYYVYRYDRLGRLIEVQDCQHETQSLRTYAPCGEIASEQFTHTLSIHKEYDDLGRVSQLAFPDNSSIEYKWGARDIQEIVRTSAKRSYRHQCLAYDLTGRLLQSSMIGLGIEERTYDVAGRKKSISSPWHGQEVQKRDLLGHITQQQRRIGSWSQGETFDYDCLSQLQKEHSPYFKHAYQFDPEGHRLAKNDEPCITNALHQILSSGSSLYTYDPLGSRIASQGAKELIYHYDLFQRLAEVIEEGRSKTTFAYDAFDRRMEKITYRWSEGQWRETSALFFLYDGQKEIGIIDAHGQMSALRILHPSYLSEAGAAIALELGHHLYAPLHDFHGNVIGLVNASTKTLVESYLYSAFGEEKIFNTKGGRISFSAIRNPWRYHSKHHDEETGLIYFGLRYYDPQIGSWLTPDPAANADGPNQYAFVHNNPLNYLDPFGLLSTSDMEPRYSWGREATPMSRCLDRIATGIGQLFTPFGYLFHAIGGQIPFPCIRDGFIAVGHWITQGATPGIEHSERFLQSGKDPGRLGVVSINGILNTREDAQAIAAAISGALDGISTHGVHNASNGLLLDLVDCSLELCGHATHPCQLLKKQILKNHQELHTKYPDGNFRLLAIAHSEGTIILKQVLQDLKRTHPEVLNHMSAASFGAAAIIGPDLLKDSQVFISDRDPVGLLDIVGRLKGGAHLHILPSKGGMPGMDHMMLGETYRTALEDYCRKFKNKWDL